MIDHLHDLLPYLEHLPPEVQEEAAAYIEALMEALEHKNLVLDHIQQAQRKTQPVQSFFKKKSPPLVYIQCQPSYAYDLMIVYKSHSVKVAHVIQ